VLKPINKRVFLVEDPHHGKIPHCHCMYVDDERRVLIDSSSGPEIVDGLAGREVDLLLTSHFHEDHILNHDAFPKAEIWAHYLDAPGIRSQTGFKALYGFNVFGQDELGDFFVNFFGLKDYRVDGEFSDGHIFDLGHTQIQVMHLPGHTAGHCGFYFPDDHLLFTWDIDLSGFGPWYGNAVSDVDDFIASINKIKDLKPKMIISSHKGIIKDHLNLRLNRYLQSIYQHEEDLLEVLKIPQDLDQLADLHIIYGKPHEPYDLYRFGEKLSLLVHLRRLQRLGAVKVEGGIYFRS